MVTQPLVLSGLLFGIGAFGFLVRRNAIIMFLCIELQLNAVNLSFVALSRTLGIEGQLYVFFVMTVAAAEAAIGLAILVCFFRNRGTIAVEDVNVMKGRATW